MSAEVQIAKIVCTTFIGGVGIYYAKDIADNYFELKALSAMPESYFATQQKEAEMELKKTEIHEAAETERKEKEIAYKKEKDEKDRLHQLEVMEKEKAYPDSYWIYKTEKVKTESYTKTQVKKEEASIEKQKTLWHALTTGFEVFTRRYL